MSLPYQAALVERLRNRPFALLGINSDCNGDAGKVGSMLKEHKITWRQGIDGTIQGPLATRWNVLHFPTFYVLDAKGVIRFKKLHHEKLGEAVDALLAERRS